MDSNREILRARQSTGKPSNREHCETAVTNCREYECADDDDGEQSERGERRQSEDCQGALTSNDGANTRCHQVTELEVGLDAAQPQHAEMEAFMGQ
ncbi:MAG: hypothetical protein U5K37_03045 [Natrialbaceae archaeon]|nr:hypothetical protein [Natrialbaceae archaeon]